MDNYTIIKAFGLETRTWAYKEEYGYGCAECCNGDRCDDDCTAKYRRPNCPHCKGKGWIKKEDVEPMTNNTQPQLPAEFQKELDDLVMKHTLELRNDNDYQIGYEKGIEKSIEIGAAEYASKLHACDKAKATLEEKVKGLEGNYGKVSTMILDLDTKYEQARALLQKFISRHEAGLLPDRFIYNDIKSFLDGEK